MVVRVQADINTITPHVQKDQNRGSHSPEGEYPFASDCRASISSFLSDVRRNASSLRYIMPELCATKVIRNDQAYQLPNRGFISTPKNYSIGNKLYLTDANCKSDRGAFTTT